jgi:phage gpG-like protein
MSATVKIQMTPAAEKIIRTLQTLPPRMLAAVARAMDQTNLETAGWIQQKHLNGKGPFPPEQHRLGVVNHRLINSVTTGPNTPGAARIEGQTITSSIGSNVKYAAIHEFGGRIQIPPRQGRVTLVDGLFASQKQFFKALHRRRNRPEIRRVLTNARGYTVNIPARAPFTTGINERSKQYAAAISKAIVAAWKDENSGSTPQN